MPSVGEIDSAVGSYIPADRVAAIRTLIRAAVEQALAEQEARHERELIEARIDAIENFDGWTSFEWVHEMRAKLAALEVPK